MRQKEVSGFRAEFPDGVENFPFQRHFHHMMGLAIGHEQRVIRGNKQAKWCKAAEGADEFAILIEDLNAIIFAIPDVKISLRIQSHRVRRVEFSLAGSLFPPGENKLAALVEFHHPRITIAVGDEEISIRRKGDVGRLVEMSFILAGYAFFSERHQNFSID